MDKFEVLVVRLYKTENYTIGKLYINGVYQCDTLEDKDRGLDDSMSVDEIKKLKVYGVTAIPTGTYKLTYTYSPKYKRNMPLVNNVKGYDGIRIHSGNTDADSLGCILLGENKVKGQVINSRVACTAFYEKVEQAVKANIPMTITIR